MLGANAYAKLLTEKI